MQNKNKNIKFSIIIPVYNASGFIKDTLDSVKNQTYKNYEVLVTNDGSTDNTEKVLEEYRSFNPEFPLYLNTQKNSGVSSARNNSVSRAKGNYVAFLDQDDLWFPEKLEKVAEVLSSNPDIDVLYHEALIVGWRKGNDYFKYGALKEPFYLDLLFNGNKISVSTATVKLEKLKKAGGFSKVYIYSEDYDLWIRLAKEGANFYYLPDFLSKYIWWSGSESNKVENMTNEKLAILEDNYKLILEEKKYDKKNINRKYKRAKSVTLFGASRRFYFLNDYKRAVEYSIRAIKTDKWFYKPYIGLLLLRLKNKKSLSGKNKNN